MKMRRYFLCCFVFQDENDEESNSGNAVRLKNIIFVNKNNQEELNTVEHLPVDEQDLSKIYSR